MTNLKRSCCWVVTVILVLISGGARAEFVTNGNFEDTTGWGSVGSTDFPPGWQSHVSKPNPAAQQGGGNQIAGTTSAFIPSGGGDRRMANVLTSPIGPDWEFNVDFACEDPTGGGNRTLDIALNSLFLRVVGGGIVGVPAGTVQAFSGTWQTIPGLEGAVTFDSDVQVAPTVHHMKMVTHFGNGTPSYDITISREGESDKVANGVTLFNGAPPSASFRLSTIVFHNSQGSAGDYVIDNVSVVPEPSAIALISIAVVAFMQWKKRS